MSVEIESSKYYNKGEMLARFMALAGAGDIVVTDSSKGKVLTSPDSTEWRETISNDGITTWTSI